MAKDQQQVIGGVDTHADSHTVAVVDQVGRILGSQQFPADATGFARLLRWLRQHGQLVAVGVEGTGSYGAGLARYLRAQQVSVVEVDRPDRKARRARGKSDPVDAEAAARAVLAGTAAGTPKHRDGIVEAIRAVQSVRAGAVKARTSALNSLLALARTCVEPLHAQLRGLTARQLVVRVADLPGHGQLSDPAVAATMALQRLVRRITLLDEEITAADRELRQLTRTAAPELLARNGVGPDVTAQLLITAGDNPERLTGEASFARLTGAAPLPASSGRTTRHRLNRGGDRQANRALHTVVLSRMRHDPRTQAYVARRTAEGLSKKEIMRCLKRYVARELFPLVLHAPNNPHTLTRSPEAAANAA